MYGSTLYWTVKAVKGTKSRDCQSKIACLLVCYFHRIVYYLCLSIPSKTRQEDQGPSTTFDLYNEQKQQTPTQIDSFVFLIHRPAAAKQMHMRVPADCIKTPTLISLFLPRCLEAKAIND